MPTSRHIALTVIGGFLGAGKSTLLNRILASSQRRTAVLVNDFGPVNIDAALVASRDGDTISLANGCVCCSIGAGLDDALIRVMARDPAPEWIVIEASGVSDPGAIAQVGMADPMLELESVLVVVDATRIQEQAEDPLLADTVGRQLDAAGVLVLSKTDLAGPSGTAAARDWLARRAAGVPAVSADAGLDTLQAMTPPAILAPKAGQASDDGRAEVHAHSHPADHPFESWFWQPDGPLIAEALTRALKQMPRSVVRAKGWVRTDRHGQVLVQYAGRRVRYAHVQPAAPMPEGLVLIAARGVDRARIAGLLRAAAGANEYPPLVLHQRIGAL